MNRSALIAAAIAGAFGLVAYILTASAAILTLSTVTVPVWIWIVGAAVTGYFGYIIAATQNERLVAVLISTAIATLAAFAGFDLFRVLGCIAGFAFGSCWIVGAFQSRPPR